MSRHRGHALTAPSEQCLDSQTSLGCPSDAYANSDPSPVRAGKPTDAESGRHAASHTKLHTVVLKVIDHLCKYTIAICSHCRHAQPDLTTGHGGEVNP